MEATGNPAVDAVLMWGGVIIVIAGVLTLLWRAVRASVRLTGRVEDFMDDWSGAPGRPGVPPRPGVMERLAGFEDRLTRVEHELHPNSGQSLRDAVDLANVRLARICPDPEPEDPDPPAPH